MNYTRKEGDVVLHFVQQEKGQVFFGRLALEHYCILPKKKSVSFSKTFQILYPFLIYRGQSGPEIPHLDRTDP